MVVASTLAGLIISGVGTATAMAGTGVGIANAVADGETEFTGASSGQRISEQAARSTADKLAMGGGLSETEYSRMSEAARTTQNQIGAQAVGAARNTPQIPSIALDKLVRGAFREQASIAKTSQDKISSADIGVARQQIKDSIGAENVAGARSDAVVKADVTKERLEAGQRQQARANLSAILGDVGTTMYGAVDTLSTLSGQYKADKLAQGKVDDASYSAEFDKNNVQDGDPFLPTTSGDSVVNDREANLAKYNRSRDVMDANIIMSEADVALQELDAELEALMGM